MAGDANYSSVTLLLHGAGANNSATIVDNSPTPKAVTVTGDAKISTAQSKFGGSSIAFDGAGDYLAFTTSGLIGILDLTIEGWVFLNAATDGEILCIGNLANTSQYDLVFEVLASGGLRGSLQNGAGVAQIDLMTATGLIGLSAWTHVAFSVSGTTGKLFIGGTERASGTVSGTRVQARSDCRVGFLATAVPRPFNGYIDDLRITKGVARYTGNFTPPTVAFPDSTILVTISGNVKDDAGANCARTIYAYRRDTGALIGSTVSNAGTGNYSIDTPYDGAHILVFLDDVAGTTYNALVLDRIVPI